MKPEYLEVAEKLKKDLIQGKYQISSRLPDEKELMEIYQAGRPVIRRAMAVLVNQGVIYPLQQQNYYIRTGTLDGCISLESWTGFSNQFPDRKVAGIPLKLELIAADEEMAARFRVETGTLLYHLKRLRIVDEEPYAVESSWFSKDKAGELTVEIAKGSIYRYLTKEQQLTIGYADRILSADKLTAEEADLLCLSENDPAFRVQNTVFLSDGSIVEISDVVHHYKKYKLTKLSGWN
ncbi:MAG: GntR family transcriptional regulator [Erysipelotrichaceae bacterium]|nr:GntR family transcriptional regulator [Erysipelotrichaceae bacterium]